MKKLIVSIDLDGELRKAGSITGSECLGAIRISDNKNELPEASYIPLSVSDVAALAAEGASRSAEIITKTHLSLTGASGKVGLYFDAPAGQWYLPQGNANSVDILMLSE